MIMKYINYKMTGFNLVVDFLQLFYKNFYMCYDTIDMLQKRRQTASKML